MTDIIIGQCAKTAAPWRPSASGSFTYSTDIDGKKWYLERSYTWLKLDQSFFLPRYIEEAKEIWPRNKKLHGEILGEFDNDGRLWVREELSSHFLIPYYLQHPAEYIRVMSDHVKDVLKLVAIVTEVNQTLDDESQLAANIKRMNEAYQLQYGCPSTIYFVSDELIWDFKEFLLTFLDKKTANIYFSNFSTAEITKRLLAENAVDAAATDAGSRGILYASGQKPSVKYFPPKFFHQYPQDAEVMEKLMTSGADEEKINKFLAYRLIIPITFQINEEAHYIETQLLSAHLSYLLRKIAEIADKDLEELQQLSWQEIINILNANHMDKDERKTIKPILKGVGVSRGQASGRVKIINDGFRAEDFAEGDVLVAKITDPSMVVLMARAGAVVTDIGGLTSHPAITCREMGIPCVVATKSATTTLKDGMAVKVNGATGEIFCFEDDDKDIGDLIEAYRRGFANMDCSTFEGTTDYTKLDPLFAKSWTKWLSNIIDETKKQGLSPKEVATLVHTPSTLRNVAIFELFMASVAGLKSAERKKIARFFINALRAICQKDPFCLQNHNVIHTPEDIRTEAAKTKPASPEVARKLGRLVSACYHLGYSLFGDMNPQLVYENFGPYYIKDQTGRKLLVVIKEYKNLKPIEIWPETASLPFETIRIVSAYQDVGFTIDAITHTNYDGDVINGLKYYAVEIDGRPASLENVSVATEQIQNLAELVWEKFKALDDREFRIKYLYHRAYNYINLCRRLGLDWRPSQEMINEITSKPLKTWPKFNDARAGDEYFLKIIDPRTDFSG